MKTKQCDLLGLVFLLCFQTAVLGAEKNGDLLGTAKASGDRKPSSSTIPTESVLLLGEPTGPEKSFDCGTKETNWESAIGMATMRTDGFAAWEAGAESGELVTQPFRCNGDRLFINAEAQNGSVAVEVLDEKGKPLKGFETKSCRIVTTDTLAKERDGWVQWKKEKDLRRLQGKPIRLRFTLKNARLYSFRVADKKTMQLPVPRATTR